MRCLNPARPLDVPPPKPVPEEVKRELWQKGKSVCHRLNAILARRQEHCK